MLSPCIILFFTFAILPLIYTAVYSFTSWQLASQTSKFVGLKNYISVVSEPRMHGVLKNTLIFAFVSDVMQPIIGVPVAIILNQKIRFRNFFKALFYSPSILSALIVGYLWSFILSPRELGLLNSLLKLIHLGPVNALGNPKYALISVIAVSVWQWFGLGMLIYLGNLQSIPNELYEAADIDGCGTWNRFWNITLPHLIPSIQFCFITSMCSGLQVFDIIFSMTGGGPGQSTNSIMLLMFREFSYGNYAYAASCGVLSLIFIMIITRIILKLFSLWEKKIR
jgi:raffinose/stachyose/melibiose transport system permease protein